MSTLTKVSIFEEKTSRIMVAAQNDSGRSFFLSFGKRLRIFCATSFLRFRTVDLGRWLARSPRESILPAYARIHCFNSSLLVLGLRNPGASHVGKSLGASESASAIAVLPC
jgi:hypothetical protein